MNNLIENLVAASQRIKAEQDKPNKCEWCLSEISRNLNYCEGTDCQYDGEKWARYNQ